MIKSYTVAELEQKSGTTRRTISDYIAKGFLAGPSHRGRGARYPQKDLDVLTVLPRIRTLMKKEYPTLKEVSAFLEQLSVRDINRLANLTSEETFVAEMRRLRVRNSLMSLVPYVAPERIDQVLGELTPGQIRGIDAGRYQIGAVLDVEALFSDEANGMPSLRRSLAADASDGATSNAAAPSWSVSWLNGHEESDGEDGMLHPEDVITPDAARRRAEQQMADTTTDLVELVADNDATQPDLPVVDDAATGSGSLEDRLGEIAARLEKLESMLEKS